MNTLNSPKNWFGLLLLSALIGCNDPPPPNFNCRLPIYVDSILEEFCVEPSAEIQSKFVVTDDRFLSYQDSDTIRFARSSNFEAYLIAYASTKPQSTDLDTEVEFMSNLQKVFKPGSQHFFDLGVDGGLALELFGRDGEYYSTEYSIGDNNASFTVYNSTLALIDPAQIPEEKYSSILRIQFAANDQILLANEDGSKELLIEFEHPYISIGMNFGQFRQ
jgi:hypothetical protein